MSKMNVDALKANLTNPARSYLWEILFVNPIGGGSSESLRLRCQSTAVPGFNFGSIVIPFKQTPGVKFPGKLNMSHTWTSVFIEGMDKKIFDSIYAWRQFVVNDVAGIGGPDTAIKSNIFLNLLDANGDYTSKFKLIGCYPESMDDTPLAYDDESELRYSVTWSYDYWVEVS